MDFDLGFVIIYGYYVLFLYVRKLIVTFALDQLSACPTIAGFLPFRTFSSAVESLISNSVEFFRLSSMVKTAVGIRRSFIFSSMIKLNGCVPIPTPSDFPNTFHSSIVPSKGTKESRYGCHMIN